MEKPASKGVIYLALGDFWRDEAIYSARSVKKHNPLPCVLFTDQMHTRKHVFDDIVYIDKSIRQEKHPYQLKVWAMLNSPYEQTLFLDTDTEVRGSVMELLDMTEHHDMAMAAMAYVDRKNFRLIAYEKPNHLYAGPHKAAVYNTGVMAFRKSEGFIRFANSWSERVKNSGIINDGCDQSVLNEILPEIEHTALHSGIGKVPNTVYNVRSDMMPQMRRDGLLGGIRIRHDHGLHFPAYRRMYHKLRRHLVRFHTKYLTKEPIGDYAKGFTYKEK